MGWVMGCTYWVSMNECPASLPPRPEKKPSAKCGPCKKSSRLSVFIDKGLLELKLPSYTQHLIICGSLSLSLSLPLPPSLCLSLLSSVLLSDLPGVFLFY